MLSETQKTYKQTLRNRILEIAEKHQGSDEELIIEVMAKFEMQRAMARDEVKVARYKIKLQNGGENGIEN